MKLRFYLPVGLREFTLVFSVVFCSECVFALDIVKMSQPQSRKDLRVTYKLEVLQTALSLTENEFGPYQILDRAPPMKRKRALGEIRSGNLINVYFGPAKPIWARDTAVIPVPLLRGILSYRLLLINRNDLPLFRKIRTIEQLKALQAGLQVGWATAEVFSKNDFNVVYGESYDGLFHMLDERRFHYIPRGVHEIFDELVLRKAELNNVVVEPNIALYVSTRSYTYVSPGASRLKRRLEKGYRMMLDNGDLKEIFNKYYMDDIKRARLNERRLLFVDMEFAGQEDVIDDPKMWFHPKELDE